MREFDESKKPQHNEIVDYLHGLYVETGDFKVQQAADIIEDLREDVDHYIGVELDYQEKYQKAMRLCKVLGYETIGKQIETIERLVSGGHDLEMVCEVLGWDANQFDKNGRFLPSIAQIGPPAKNYFKDPEAYDKFPNKVCYIPENWDVDRDGTGFTVYDFLRMCNNDQLKADILFDLCEGEHPNKLLLEYSPDAEITLGDDTIDGLFKLANETGNEFLRDAALNMRKYRDIAVNGLALAAGLADTFGEIDLETIELLALSNYDPELVFDIFGVDPDDFRDIVRQPIAQPRASQPLNEQIRNAADRAGEGVNNAPPKAKER